MRRAAKTIARLLDNRGEIRRSSGRAPPAQIGRSEALG